MPHRLLVATNKKFTKIKCSNYGLEITNRSGCLKKGDVTLSSNMVTSRYSRILRSRGYGTSDRSSSHSRTQKYGQV